MANPMEELFKQAQKMQAQMKDAQEEIGRLEVTGESGAGLVRVVMNGKHDVVRVSVDDAVLQEEKSMLEDLLAAAVNDAVRKVEEEIRSKFSGMALGNLGGQFKMPF